MKLRRLVILFAVVGLLFVSASPASAFCDNLGKVIFLNVPPSGNATVYLTLNTATLPSFVYSYTFPVTNHTWVSALGDALGSGTSVFLLGGAASCPTSGGLRAAGALQGVQMFRLR